MRRTRGEKVFNICNIIFMVFLCVIMIYPYLNQLAISLNEGMDARMGGITLWPRRFTLENYKTVVLSKSFLDSALVSVSNVVLRTLLSLAVVFCCAYGITRKGLPHRKGITLFLMIPSYITAGVIPVFMLYRYLGLINNYLVYILPALFSFYNMVIMRSFIQELPQSLEESALVDGANEIQCMWHIVLPLCLPVLATVALWTAVAVWNDWTTTLLYITDKKLFNLQYIMMKLVKESSLAQEIARESTASGEKALAAATPETVKAATLIVTTLPIIAVYPFLQKYFIHGITLGSVKG